MKRARTLLIVLMLCALAAELAGLAGYRVVTGTWYSPARVRAGQAQAVATAAAVESGKSAVHAVTTALVPHPFIGFVYDPAYDPEGTRRVHGVPASPWGFLDDKAPIRPADTAEAVVGITGGSVAFWYSMQGVEAMLVELARVPAFRGKRLVVVRTALGGTKQPQQLMTLTYLLSLGAHFDAIVNIDGFNEIALPPATLIPHGIFPFFPRDWQGMLGATGDPARLRAIGEITYLQQVRGELAAAFARAPFRWSPLAATVWTLRDRALEGRLARAQLARLTPAAATPGIPANFASGGPRRSYATAEAMYVDLARVWRDSSLQMHRLATANGIAYFHFLQPNQYVAGSKPMSQAEMATAILANGPFAAHVRAGYPTMQADGRALTAAGVRFYDLTGLFKSVAAPLYIDNCCHVSADANVLMGRRIGQLMAAALAG